MKDIIINDSNIESYKNKKSCEIKNYTSIYFH